jgi:hypothetical protein
MNYLFPGIVRSSAAELFLKTIRQIGFSECLLSLANPFFLGSFPG